MIFLLKRSIFPARASRSPPSLAAALGAEAVNPWRGITTPELIAEAHGAGLAVHVFTVNEVEDMARLLDWKVDGIFTNYPDQLRRLVDRRDVNPELNR